MFQGLSPESQGQNLALTALCVPHSLDSGMSAEKGRGGTVSPLRRSELHAEGLGFIWECKPMYDGRGDFTPARVPGPRAATSRLPYAAEVMSPGVQGCMV